MASPVLLSPVFFTSRSVVTVVEPPGVVEVVSDLVADFSAQPTVPMQNKLATNRLEIRRFMCLYLFLREWA